MRRVSTQEKLINWLVPKFYFVSFVGFVLVLSQSYVSQDKNLVFTAKTFTLDFSEFSPAFAAFEDEYLFEKQDAVIAAPLKSGQTNSAFQKLSQVKTQVAVAKIKTSKRPLSRQDSDLFASFDGEKLLSEIRGLKGKASQPKAQPQIAMAPQFNDAGEISFGPLAANFNPQVSTAARPTPRPSIGQAAKPAPSQPAPSLDAIKEELATHSKDKEPILLPERYIVHGGIQLKQGLAFIGSMEVSWVVGDYELQRGSINTPDATFEIEVSKLVGDVIISLYDTQDELIGEGLLDLTTFGKEKEEIAANIQVLPIDWDVAGQVVHGNSLGTDAIIPVAAAEVALYSFNEATQSDTSGLFNFYNWKKTNSRTLAIASKEGFVDSIFTLDSKTEAQVLLFENSYMDAFFDYLEDLGVYNVKDMGTVYGKIQGVGSAEGYTLRLEKSSPIYFMQAGFATLDQKATGKNGLFSFVGLQDGDYHLIVEKEGEVLDERLVVVEQGKISPVIVDLSKVSKHLEFFDPMDPNQSIGQVELGFFDGTTTRSLDQENQVRQTLNRGHDLSLIEVKGKGEVSRTLLSRHKGLQKIPLINDKKLVELAASHDLTIERGLVFGFVDTQDPYQVFVAEEAVGKVLYFDENGSLMDSDDPRAPRGFILGDFAEGLRSVIIERKSDGMVMGTDLIYSNHESISITHLEILPAPQ